jgi:MFS family permease
METSRAHEKNLGGDDSVLPHSPQLSSTNGSDLDDNYVLYKQQMGDAPADAAEAKSVLKKIDWRVLPVLWTLYLLQYLDKNGLNYVRFFLHHCRHCFNRRNLHVGFDDNAIKQLLTFKSQASVYRLPEDLGLVGQQYSWLGSIFYFGYLIAQFPAGWLMQRLPVGKFLGFTGITWGIILMTTPACTNFAGIAANRFMLGLVEAAVNPGFVLVMSMWYTSQEQPLRLEIYYCTNGIATMFGGLIGYAIGHINGALARWMYVFIIFGALSLIAGIATLFFLPDLPSTAKFLTQRERAVAVERVAANRQGVKNHNFKVDQLWQTLADPKTWILFILAVSAQVPNAAITSVSCTLLSDNTSCVLFLLTNLSSHPSSSAVSASTHSARNISKSLAVSSSSPLFSEAASSAANGPTRAALP